MKRSTNKSPIRPSWLPIIEDVHRNLPELREEIKNGRRRAFARFNKGKKRGPQPRKRRA